MNSQRKTSLSAGLFYLLTFVSIPTLVLYGPIHEPNYILGTGNDNAVVLGGISEIVVALCGIVTAVVLYPVLRKQNESLALGLIASRILEAGTMFAGVAFLLTVVSLHQKGAGADALPVGQAFVALYDRIFVLGQGFIPAINDLLLGLLLYQSRLVPRSISLIGITGGLPLVAGYLAMMFGLIERTSLMAGVSAILVAVFEFSLGIYLVVKGFKPSPLLVVK
ncbi:DUF4386 domain-containing protein [Runella sp.]|uniref:DUF4386 domain-containing protein n=1 Tax=Runella sp. TaxID=1960881 RepID=UPI003D09A20A